MMKTTNSNGFGVLPLLVVLAVIGIIAASGVYLVRNSKPEKSQDTSQSEAEKAAAFDKAAKADIRAKDFKTEGITTFKRYSFYGEEKRNEIMAKIIDPMIYYYDQVLKMPIKSVVIDINDARLSYDDSHYNMSYAFSNAPGDFGTMFGQSGRINYFIPQLCDDGGCQPYPDAMKEKFPANYQAYVACQAVNDDKAKQGELGCNL